MSATQPDERVAEEPDCNHTQMGRGLIGSMLGKAVSGTSSCGFLGSPRPKP